MSDFYTCTYGCCRYLCQELETVSLVSWIIKRSANFLNHPVRAVFFFSKILRRTGAARCFGRKRHLSVKGISRKETRKDGGDVQYHGDGRLAVCVPFAFVPHRRIIMIICTDYVLRAITLLPGRKVSIRCMLNAVFDNVDIM